MSLFEHATEYKQDPAFRHYHSPFWFPFQLRCPVCQRCWIMWGRAAADQYRCPDHPAAWPAVLKMEGQP